MPDAKLPSDLLFRPTPTPAGLLSLLFLIPIFFHSSPWDAPAPVFSELTLQDWDELLSPSGTRPVPLRRTEGRGWKPLLFGGPVCELPWFPLRTWLGSPFAGLSHHLQAREPKVSVPKFP